MVCTFLNETLNLFLVKAKLILRKSYLTIKIGIFQPISIFQKIKLISAFDKRAKKSNFQCESRLIHNISYKNFILGAIHKLRRLARGRGFAKCLCYYISLCSKLVYRGGGGQKSHNLVYVVCVWPLLTILGAASEQIKNFIIKVIQLFTGCSFTEKLNSFIYVKIDSTYLIDEFFCPNR